MKKPYVIAEVGVNFYDTAKKENIGLLEAAKKYIISASKAGADAVKFQSYKAETIVSRNSPAYWDTTLEPTKSQYELFKKYDSFGRKEYFELSSFCKKIGIDFMSTPFDFFSADYLEDMINVYKISSSDITNHPLVRYIARKGKPIILSVGASYLSEIDEAVRIIKEEGCNKLTLLHCVLSYPCKMEDANLRMIPTLKSVFPELVIGYSDHTLPDENMTVLTAAYLMGAEVIEKHFTLDKSLPGNDHYHAGDPNDFKKAISNFDLVRVIQGQSCKTVLPCEYIPRKEARRSLVLSHNMNAGEVITEKDILIKRPGTGIKPQHLELVIGKTLKQDLLEDTVLTWDMI